MQIVFQPMLNRGNSYSQAVLCSDRKNTAPHSSSFKYRDDWYDKGIRIATESTNMPNNRDIRYGPVG